MLLQLDFRDVSDRQLVSCDMAIAALNGSLAASPSAELMRGKAKQWGMHVSGTFYGREGNIVFNTALLFGRNGALIGVHRKK